MDALTLDKMSDPKGIYASMMHNSLTSITVNNPNIHDGKGVLMPASDYQNKLKDQMVSMVEAYMKVYKPLT